jgi:hypothetical protein
VYKRQALLVCALTPLAALGLARVCTIVARISPRRATSIAAAVCATACVVSVVELAFVPLPLSNIGNAPAAYGALAQTRHGVLAEYPLETNMSPHAENSAYVFWQKIHGRRLLNGAGRSTPADSVRRMLVDPRARGTAPSLALLGVTAIITRPTTFDWDQSSTIPDTSSYGPGYRLVAGFPGDVRLWDVTARPASAIAAYRGGDVGEPLAPTVDGFVAYPVESEVVHLDVYAKQPGRRTLQFDVRGGVAGATLRVAGANDARTFSLRARTQVAIPLALQRGKSTLTVTVGEDGRRVSLAGLSFSSTWFAPPRSASQKALHPILVSHEPGF